MPVVSFDVYDVGGERFGQVVEAREKYLVVEHGLLFKSQRAVPRTLAKVDFERRAVTLEVERAVVADSPVLGADIDTTAVDAYYAKAAAERLKERAEVRRFEREREGAPV